MRNIEIKILQKSRVISISIIKENIPDVRTIIDDLFSSKCVFASPYLVTTKRSLLGRLVLFED